MVLLKSYVLNKDHAILVAFSISYTNPSSSGMPTVVFTLVKDCIK